MASDEASVGIADIKAARRVIAGVARLTPVLTTRWLSDQTGRQVVLKAENLQRTGSFKIRGAANKLASLGDLGDAGVVCASAGNHAQAVALAASRSNVPCEVFMPGDASIGKTEATRAYGAKVNLGGRSIEDALVKAKQFAEDARWTFVHPFEDLAVIAGQGTIGLELVEQVDDIAQVIVPIGGGGLISGTAIAIKSLQPGVQVVGVQAAVCAPVPASIEARRPVEFGGTAQGVVTLADGIAVKRPGEITFPLIEHYVDEVVTVTEDEIADAMVLLLERTKLVVEGAGAVGAAALLGQRVPEARRGGRTVVVLSGGNVDSGLLPPAIRRHETNAGRRIVVYSVFADRPGQLAGLLTCIGETGANVVTVEHIREGFDLHVRETAVHITLETRNREHAEQMLAAAHAAGYRLERVEPDPFAAQ